MKKILIYIFIFFSIVPHAIAQDQKEWKQLFGQWNIKGSQITPVTEKSVSEKKWAITLDAQNRDSIWESLSCDFRLSDNTSKHVFGLLLNVRSKADYQILQISGSANNTIVKVLHWQYGKFNQWKAYKIKDPLVQGQLYNIAVVKAPLVDKEDWRPWKIVFINKTTNKLLLRKGIDNVQPAISKGITGLYTETPNVVFDNFSMLPERSTESAWDLRLAPLFRDGMVLQRNTNVKIWGKSKPEKKIYIEIAGKKYSTISDKEGNWNVVVNPLKAQTGLLLKVVSENKTLRIHDVAVGEVWLASGQSNMVMRARQSDVATVAKQLHDDDIRFFIQPHWPSSHRVFNSGGNWIKADTMTAPGFSAVALSFAIELRRKLNVPIGIITSDWGGSIVENWLPFNELQTNPVTIPIRNKVLRYQKMLEKDGQVKVKFPETWYVPGQRHTPGYLFNGMISPHIPFSLKGVIWYQGESNAYNSKQYKALFPMMISSWRAQWQMPTLPFLYVQLPGYDGKEAGNEIKDAWPTLREAQLLTLNKLDHTGMVVTLDLGERNQIHPFRKREVGIRLSKLAFHDVYGFSNIEAHSPLYKNVVFNKDHAIVYFSNTGDGLKILKGDKLNCFYIAGEDHHFVPAKAVISHDKKSVKVYAKSIKKPVSVRYGWENYPDKANLGNSAGLPASPFRTDSWPLGMEENKTE